MLIISKSDSSVNHPNFNILNILLRKPGYKFQGHVFIVGRRLSSSAKDVTATGADLPSSHSSSNCVTLKFSGSLRTI